MEACRLGEAVKQGTEQPKPGSASIVTATLGDRLRSLNVADLVRTLEKVKVIVNVRGSDKQRRRKARRAAASAAPFQPSTFTGPEKGIGGPNTWRLDGNRDKGSLRGTSKPPSNSPQPRLDQPEALPSRVKAPEPSTTLRVAKQPRPDPRKMDEVQLAAKLCADI
ncbi:hypothetical protein JTB14_013561 [Gonioctena quinquepunctata]|nr:hypothetical protein JTB14_013561 [Gonioctena quinquepunctata]